MESSVASSAPVKSALFVDFDNIYIGLSKTEPQAAERFASDPARWLAWLERGLPNRNGGLVVPRTRSILIRRCYPNPDAGFRRFRSFFTSAAFSVIDCPSLTRMGKNSSDIYMVMDILDTLTHKTHFDEFIIFSGDSDFMPVLLRLRAHDRRTTTLGIDFMPPAYKAACDLVISEEEFIEDALGVTHENCSAGGGRGRASMPLLKEMALRVYEAACVDGEVPGADLPDILKDFREFRDSNNWLGFGTSQRLAEALACSEPRLELTRLNAMTYKIVIKRPEVVSVPLHGGPTGVQGRGNSAPLRASSSPSERPAAEREPAREGAPAERESGEGRSTRADMMRMRAQIVDLVREMVSNSRSALLLARVSQYVVSRMGPRVLETQWAGAGSFKRLLQGTSDLGLEITTHPEPGYIFDPSKHTPPPANRGRVGAERAEPEDEHQPEREAFETAKTPLNEEEAFIAQPPFEPGEERAFMEEQHGSEDEDEDDSTYEEDESLPTLEEFVMRVSRVTGAPDLSPVQYALVFHGIVVELQAIARGEKMYNTYQSSKAVSDWCAEQGVQISRGDIVLIFKGIIYQDGVRFGKRPDSFSERELACVVRDNIKALCRRSRLELSEYENHLLDEWIISGLDDEGSLAAEEEGQPRTDASAPAE